MPRNKIGLDYFDFACYTDEKIKLIQAEFGLKGFAIVVKLLQKIYGELGYYCEWNNDSSLLFASENGASSRDEKNLIEEIVSACIRRGIFSQEIYLKYGILTSEKIQETYLNATSRRDRIEMKKEYLLVSVAKINKNVVVNEVSVNINSINVDRNAQSREEKSREENNKKTLCKADALALFEKVWKVYPLKRGKGQVSLAAKLRLLEVGYDELVRAIDRYKAELEKDSEWRKPQNGSTFFNSGYIDYLDANYVPSASSRQKDKNQFNRFEQRDYSHNEMSELESQLLGRK